MVGNQIANQAAKPLKKGEKNKTKQKKTPVLEQQNWRLSCSVTSLVSSPV
jgi:hypothetical protein